MKKVKATAAKDWYYFAYCPACDWNDVDYQDKHRIYNAARKHVLDTGHRVAVEITRITRYLPKKECPQ